MNHLTLVLDVGTTTVKGLLIKKPKEKELASEFVLNEQIKYGEDIITRIDFALKSHENADKLKKAVLGSVNELVKKLVSQLAYKAHDIKEAVVVCNTAMHHLFLGISAATLIKPPYKALQKSEIIINAREAGIDISKDAPVIILPNIGGFVGSDAIGLIIASGIYKDNNVKLAIDIGTNGEVVLGSAQEILVTSTAAGPAFEGGYVSCGMPAVNGAIEKVKILKNGSVKISTIGSVAPKGICGSGLIDLVAEMFRTGLVDKTGKMKEQSFNLYKKGNTAIFITQADIRKLQLAKAAIYAAAKILMRHMNIEKSEISKVIMTGSFGSCVDPKNALLLGLLPGVSASRVEFIKDASLIGAKRYILSKEIQNQLISVLSKVKRIPLAGKSFQDIYADSMAFA
ncbi:MAG: ASKHA domain-containing protein [Candidatus Omnitrophota bacterium]